MRLTELLRLVWLNINQNKFKTVMTSIGIIVGAATIVMVIGIGRGGQMDVAEQFSSLNAGAIDISYEYEGSDTGSGSGFSFGSSGFSIGGFSFGGGMSSMGGRSSSRGSSSSDSSAGGFSGGGMSGFTQGGSSDSSSSSGTMPDMSSRSGGSMPDMSSMGDGSMPDMSSMGESSMPDRSDMGDGSMPDMSSMGNGSMPDMSSMGDGTMSDRSSGSEDGTSSRSGKGNAEDGSSGERSADAGEEAQEQADTEYLSEADSEKQLSEAEDQSALQETETEADLTADRMNQENIILTAEEVEDIELFVSGITGATISYSTRGSVEGGTLTEAQTYTIAGVQESYATLSNLELAAGTFLTEEEDYMKARVCVLGSSIAKELFGSAADAYDSTIYIEDRAYVVNGVLESSGTVSAGISPDDAIFIPYQTGVKYITGESISPVITVIAEDVNALDTVIADVNTVLTENYENAEFTFSDAGSKMEAAESSNEILTLLLAAMAAIVFSVGGIGIMNVLFVSVKERTGEIGILKSLGASRSIILFEFLLESAAISLLGGVLGVGASFLVTPVVEHYGIRVEANSTAWFAALGFALLTGTLFGIYPAWKASRLEPVEALNATD